MKKILLLVAAVGFLQSCATFKPLPEATLEGQARTLLGGPSQVEPLKLVMEPDYVFERLTLVRVEYINKNGASSPAPDSVLGVSFGNGLFLDNIGNLSVRMDELLGIDSAFVGTTELVSPQPNSDKMVSRKAVYSANELKVTTEPDYLFAPKYTLNLKEKKLGVQGENITFETNGHIKVEPFIGIPFVSGQTWEKTATGVKKSYWDSFLGIIPYIKSVEYILKDGVVIGGEKAFLVENTGSYLRFSYTKGNHYSYRIYRTPAKFLVIDETTGNYALVSKTDAGLEWQLPKMGFFGVTKEMQDYQLKMSVLPQ